MLEKILDKYFTKKLMTKICDNLYIYYLDKQVIYHKNYAEFKVKKKKFKEEYYNTIFSICNDESLEAYLNFDEIIKAIKHQIKCL